MNRRIALEGVDNFRDFGGYATTDRRRMRERRFYRSASHARATDADLDAIGALGIGVVVDLRRLAERQRDPSRRHPQFSAEVIVNDDESQADTWYEHIRTSDLSAEGFGRYMLEYYRDAPFEARHIDLFGRFFDALETADTPVLIHCAAGKDRTGILAALVHHLAGVSREDAMADYLLTNDPQRLATRMPLVAKAIFETVGRTPGEDALKVALGVAPDYLRAALTAIETAFGGVDEYLAGPLRLSPARRERIRQRLLE